MNGSDTPVGAPPMALEAACVLLVNDDPRALFALRAVLAELDVNIVSAASGEQALIRLLRQDFCVIVMDVKMAGLDGFETARLIRSRARSQATPIIFLTSHRATDLDRARGLALGADYLFMPVAPELLRAKVQSYVDHAQRPRLLRHADIDGRADADADAAGSADVDADADANADADAGYGSARAPDADDGAASALDADGGAATLLRPAARLGTGTSAAGYAGAQRLAASAETERLIIEHVGQYVAVLDSAGAWLYASPSYASEFGAAIEAGASYLDIVHAADRERVHAALLRNDLGAGHRRGQYRVCGQSERHFESDVNAVPAPSGALAQLVVVSRDVTERKEMEAYVLHQSFHDALTGLPNRLLLRDRMGQATSLRERARVRVAVLFIDLDHFKEVNDTLGHAAGDRLLQDVAERLGACVRDGDTVARLGGDEFVVMLVGLNQLEDAAIVAAKIIGAIGAPCRIDGSELRVAPSIGIAIFPDDGADPDTLLRNADTAMYHAKHDGGARYAFFAPQMEDAARRKLALGGALGRALAGDEFVLHYQPKVCTRSGAISGFEALIRWPQRDGDWIAPSVFIPVAEETGRIERIGAWAIGQAARELQRWQARGVDDVPIAVNVSALQLRRPTVAAELAEAARASGVAPALLEVELTESGVMSNPALAIATLHQIHAQGMTIAIDDFGTGYSSFAYLKRFPIDKLKIDASFVRDIATDPSDAAIVEAIITLAHVLRLTVVAEGVETAAQMAFLIDHGCDEMQGNYFSAALPCEGALALLARGPFALA